MKTSTTAYEFSSPAVPVANPNDGLLQVADLDKSVLVNIQLWSGVRPGYLVQLKWDNIPIGVIRLITETDKPGDVLTLPLDPEYFNVEGTHRLGFKATNNESQVSNDSPTIPIIIDRTPPGATLLAPMIFPDVTLGEALTGVVPGYAGMQAGDLIQAMCNGAEGPSITVQAEHLTTAPVTIQFDRPFLQAQNDDEVTIDYFVTDRAGNTSIASHCVTLTLQL